MTKELFDKLIEYSKSDIYSFAMPGHKRLPPWDTPDPFLIDITEIEGFDNLHNPSGVIAEVMEKAAKVCKSYHAALSVNGSTAGILSALFSLPPESNVLIARNCHKSVYDGCFLNNLKITSVEPEWVPELEIFGGINPNRIEDILNREETGFAAVVVTSPTYEGFVSDIKSIAEAAHIRGALCIVDSAHGAHFHLSDAFPFSALECGADIVIESLHKTMPALNQTALVLVNDDDLAKKVERRLDALLTTSPSYVLMASMDRCLTYAESGRFDFEEYIRRLTECRNKLKRLENLRLADKDLIGKYGIHDVDISKIVLYSEDYRIRGRDIYESFMESRLQPESFGFRYMLAMTSVADTDEGFYKLVSVAERFDAAISNKKPAARGNGLGEEIVNPQISNTLSEIEGIETEKPYDGFIYLYPPGIPVIIPGEIFTEEIKRNIISAAGQGISIIMKEKI